MDRDRLALADRAHAFADRTALRDASGTWSYRALLDASARVATALLAGRSDLDEARVAFLVPPGRDWVAIQWGIWRAGGVAVPLASSHPAPELAHTIRDSDPELVIGHPELAERITPVAAELGRRYASTNDLTRNQETTTLPAIDPARRATILYTSGTTGKPKGVVSRHAEIVAQVECLVTAWGWSERDVVLNVLPLHHVHGIVNVLTCALWSGATCEFLRFEPDAVWDSLAGGDVTLVMAVPTIYHRLIGAWEASSVERRERLAAGSGALRLMVSGSAALPVTTLERWRAVTGHVLLERYGMTEIGMALSNPLDGERVAGTVGAPLPGVDIRIVDDAGAPASPGEPGEIQVRGPGVFREYWRNPVATEAAFRDGWFTTGDRAVVERGRYRILGRLSVDIIKSGGEKISALEIEDCLRTHPAVADCAVVGIPDPEWGQRVAAVVVPADARAGTSDLAALRAWAKDRLASYKVPRELLVVDELPRNAMGKVFKPDVVRLFEGEDGKSGALPSAER